MAETEFTTISVKYLAELEAESRMLDALYAVGVDNWEGYELALEELPASDF